jgi:hypothetical protein
MAQSGARAGENSLKSANLAADAAGRGVLERAVAILDALADSDQGLG